MAALFSLVFSLIFMNINLDGSNRDPAMSFLPMPDQASNPGSTLIWIHRYRNRLQAGKSNYGLELENYFKNYVGRGAVGTSLQTCSFDNGLSATDTAACALELTTMLHWQCSENYSYFGYGEEPRPCILIKLDRVYDWVPEPYETLEDLTIAKAKGMPAYLLLEIEKRIKASDPVSKAQLKTVWISCEGENPADKENIGVLGYYSAGISETEFPGIPAYFFPYKNQATYKSPFVFVKLLKPQVNVLINIRCTAWAKNIDSQKRHGSVHFELMID